MATWVESEGASEPDPLTDLMKCTICIDRYNRPRVLPCLHSFCERCLQLHMETYANDPEGRLLFISTRTFPCPTCRENTAIPATGVKGFKYDFRIEQLDDLLKQISRSNTSAKNTTLTDSDSTCDFCPDERKLKASCKCLKCQRNFCRGCALKHKSLPLFKDHVVTGLDVEWEGERVLPLDFCQIHGTEKADLFCLTCGEAVCVKCTMTAHGNHKLADMQSELSSYYDTASSLCELLENRLSQLQKIMTQLDSNEKITKQTQRETKKRVHQKAEEMIRNIREQELKLIDDLNEKSRSQSETLASVRSEVEVSLVSMRSMFDYVREMIKEEKLSLAVVPVYQELISRMEELLQSSLLQGLSDLDLTFKFTASNSKIKIGKISWKKWPRNVSNLSSINAALVLPRPSLQDYPRHLMYKKLCVKAIGKEGKLLGEFHMPKDVCFLRDGRILVADTGNDRLQLLDPNGQPLKIICEGLVRAWGVTTDILGEDIYIADALGKCVTVVDLKGTIKRKVGKFLCPCGIAVNHKGEILVTDFFSPSLYRYGQEGTLLSQFDFRDKQDRHASGVSYIAVNKQGHIIISDVSNHSVKICTKNGKRLSKISESNYKGIESSRVRGSFFGSVFSPQGLTVDENDDVLIVDGAAHSVNVHSCSGSFLSRFLEGNHRWRGLSGIAVGPGTTQAVVMTDVISHHVVLLKGPRGGGSSRLHSIVDKLPRDIVTPITNI